MKTKNTKPRLTSDEEILKLIESGQWSQHRKSAFRRACYVGAAVVVLPLAGLGVWRVATPPVKEPMVAEAHLVRVSVDSDTMSIGEGVAVIDNQVAADVAPKSIASAKKIVAEVPEEKVPSPEVEHPAVESLSIPEDLARFNEIQSCEYTMLVWNDYSDADTIVEMLNHLLSKKGV